MYKNVFSWDARKALSSLKKHGVSFLECGSSTPLFLCTGTASRARCCSSLSSLYLCGPLR